MSFMTSYYPESNFGGFTDIDGTITFYTRVNALLKSDHIAIDIGCGRGKYCDDKVDIRRKLRILKGKCRKVIGIDVDKSGQANTYLDEFRLIEQEKWPMEDASVDICISDSVIEHIPDVPLFFQECRRIIKPGGFFCARTPNLTSLFGLASKIIPNKSHERVLGLVQNDRKSEDVFPTLYRCNTKRKLQKTLKQYGFECCVYGHEAEPAYADFSRIIYYLMGFSNRFVPNSLKSTLFVFAQKKAE